MIEIGKAHIARAGTDVTITANSGAVPMALALWATVHGLVSLHLRGLHPDDAPAAERVFELALRAAVEGWLAAPRAVATA